MNLISQLKEEHKEIMYNFNSIIEDFKKRDEERVLDDIQELKDILISHFDLENKLLYPKFENSKQEELNKLGKSFSEEMKKIAKDLFAFFKKYGKISLKELLKNKLFENNLKNIIEAVKKRVSVEENILFPAYEKYFKE